MIRRALLLIFVWACCAAQPALASPKGRISPYVELSQTFGGDFSGTSGGLNDELLLRDGAVAYSSLTIGAEGAASTRRSTVAVSLRYEQRVEQAGDAGEKSRLEGLARGRFALIPGVVSLDAGGSASHTGGNGASRLAYAESGKTQRYALFAGPNLSWDDDDFRIIGSYRLGYAWTAATYHGFEPLPEERAWGGERTALGSRAERRASDVIHAATIRAGLLPRMMPQGAELAFTASWDQQNSTGADYRLDLERLTIGIAANLPVTHSLAVVGEIGYEKLDIGWHRAGPGLTVLAPEPRITEVGADREARYQARGAAGVAGLVWRPSGRTELQAYAGRRYGSTTYYGSFALAPTRRSRAALTVYDRVTTHTGGIIAEVAATPTEFQSQRDPLSGAMSPCLGASGRQPQCLTANLTPDRSLAFRGKGASLAINWDRNRTQLGLGAGYDQRRYYGQQLPRMPPVSDAPSSTHVTALKDQTWWLSANASHALDRQSSVTATANVYWLDSNFAQEQSRVTYQASVAFNRKLTRAMQMRLAIGVDGGWGETAAAQPPTSSETNYSISNAQMRGLIGFRYSF